MAWTNDNPVAIGGATKKSDYDAVFDNAQFHRDSVGNFSVTDGTAAVPIFFPTSEADTGIYFTASAMNFTVDGVQQAQFRANGLLVVDGAVDNVALGPLSEVNTGIYFTASIMNFAVDGVQKARVNANGIGVISGSANSPSHYFISSSNSGHYLIGASNVGLSLGGTKVIDYQTANTIFSNAIILSTGGETAPDVSVGGLCLNQIANDNEILTFKSSDVGHAMTNVNEADTYAGMLKASAADGGLVVTGLTQAVSVGVAINAYTTGASDTSKETGSLGNMIITSAKDDGANGVDAIDGGGNLFVIRDFSEARFILENNGDIHVDGSDTIQTFDSHDDALACQDFVYALSGKEHLNKIIKYNKEKLHKMKVITYIPKEKSKNGKEQIFMSYKGILGLFGGGIGELYGVMDLALKEIGLDYEKLKNKYRKNQLSGT